MKVLRALALLALLTTLTGCTFVVSDESTLPDPTTPPQLTPTSSTLTEPPATEHPDEDVPTTSDPAPPASTDTVPEGATTTTAPSSTRPDTTSTTRPPVEVRSTCQDYYEAVDLEADLLAEMLAVDSDLSCAFALGSPPSDLGEACAPEDPVYDTTIEWKEAYNALVAVTQAIESAGLVCDQRDTGR